MLRTRNKSKLWPRRQCPVRNHINYKELFAIWWALLLWGDELRDRALILHCDNDFARFAVNNRWTRADGLTMSLLRHMAVYMADYNIRLTVIYIQSKANTLSDALSRDDQTAYAQAYAHWRETNHDEDTDRIWQPRVPTNYTLLLQAASEWTRLHHPAEQAGTHAHALS